MTWFPFYTCPSSCKALKLIRGWPSTRLPPSLLGWCKLCKMALTENSTGFYYTRYMIRFFTSARYLVSTLMSSQWHIPKIVTSPAIWGTGPAWHGPGPFTCQATSRLLTHAGKVSISSRSKNKSKFYSGREREIPECGCCSERSKSARPNGCRPAGVRCARGQFPGFYVIPAFKRCGTKFCLHLRVGWGSCS